jgi:hypothetical protein
MTINGKVLLLNQTYEPLGTVSVPRAMKLTFKDSVTVEQLDGNRVLHSARAEFPVPSVIRRRTYVNVRQRREAASKKRLSVRAKLEPPTFYHYAETRAGWRKYIFMDVHDDRDIMERVKNEQKKLLIADVGLPI